MSGRKEQERRASAVSKCVQRVVELEAQVAELKAICRDQLRTIDDLHTQMFADSERKNRELATLRKALDQAIFCTLMEWGQDRILLFPARLVSVHPAFQHPELATYLQSKAAEPKG